MPETNKRMLYKHPGQHEIHGDFFDYTIVDDTEEVIEQAIAEGWALTTPEAKERSKEPEKPLTAAQKKAAEKAAQTNAGW